MPLTLLPSQLKAALSLSLSLFVSLSIDAATDSPGAENTPGFTITLNLQQQRLAGIRSQILTQTSPLPGIEAYAEVVDPQPLLENLAQIRQLAIEQQAKESIARLAKRRYQRLQSLGKNTQRTKVEQAKQAWLSSKSEAEILTLQLHQEKTAILTHWGNAIVRWMENQPDHLVALQQGQIKLIKLIPSRPCNDCPNKAVIEYHQQTIPLDYLGPAPSVDPSLNLGGFFFLAANPKLPVGLHLPGWFAHTQTAVVIPASAIVWQAGAPWVFIQTDENQFQRRRLLSYHQGMEKWWVTRGLKAGEKVVVDGAQILLSSAFQGQIPEEDEDDD